MARPAQNPVERFMSHVRQVASGCHEWQSKRDKQGYGQFTLGVGKHVRAHRYAWMIANGDIPAGILVLHKCDNTRCVNHEHLFVGSHSDNAKDMVAKGRHVKGERVHFARLTPDQVRAIRTATGMRKDIAAQYGVSGETIRAVRCGLSWKHVQ